MDTGTFSLSLLLWQMINIALGVAFLYFLYRVYKYVTRKK